MISNQIMTKDKYRTSGTTMSLAQIIREKPLDPILKLERKSMHYDMSLIMAASSWLNLNEEWTLIV